MSAPISFIVEAGDVAVGAVTFTGRDDGMAVASGVFLPNGVYDHRQHATELDGVSLDPSNPLALRGPDGTLLACELVALVDWSTEAGEEFGREVVAYGVSDKNFWSNS